jgi:hypothetical protein
MTPIKVKSKSRGSQQLATNKRSHKRAKPPQTKMACALLRNSMKNLAVLWILIATDPDSDYTVNKQRSLNLLFSSMFCIERKIVHVGAEKIITLYY